MATAVNSRPKMEEIQKYLMMRANKSMESGDSMSAKSWLLTSSVLFPHSFKLQYDRYLIAKQERNVVEATTCMREMLENPESCDYPELKQETRLMIDVVRLDDHACGRAFTGSKAKTEERKQMTDDERLFLRSVFDSLTNPLKHKILTTVASSCETNWFDLCHLSLISLKIIPAGQQQQEIHPGRKLMQQIDRARQSLDHASDDHVFVQMMVHDALPLLLEKDSGVDFDLKEISMRLVTVLQYFVMNSFICKPVTKVDEQDDDDFESKIMSVMAMAFKKMSWDHALVSDPDPGMAFMRITNVVNSVCGTNNTAIKKEESDAPIDLSVPSHKKQRSSSSNFTVKPDPQMQAQILFASMTLFLRCLRKYAKSLSPKVALIAVTENTSANNSLPGSRTTSLQQPDILSKSEIEHKMRKSFLMCTQCMDMVISSEFLVQEFFPLLRDIGAEECIVYEQLRRDAVLFKGQAGEFVRITMPILAAANSNANATAAAKSDPKLLCLSLQLVSACLSMHDHQSAIRHAVSCVQMLSSMGKKIGQEASLSSSPGEEQQQNDAKSEATSSKASSPTFQYISLTSESVLNFCIHSLITCLRFTTLLSVSPSDSGIGHLIVLSQYNWPKHADLFQSCLTLISHKHSQSFAYQPFAVFVKEPDILEHFMCLCERLTLQLGLTSVTIKSLSQRQQQSMTTRGVHKGVKEEQRNSLIKQMTECTSLIEPQLFIDFVLTVLAHA